MPSGQAVPMLHFISSRVSCLAAISDDSSAQAAVGQILATCLASIRVELIPAPNLAQAAGQLLTDSLQPALTPLLLSTAGKAQPPYLETNTLQTASPADLPTLQHTNADDSKTAGMSTRRQAVPNIGSKQQLLCCLLRLYHGAVDIHGQCAAMQPQVDPLPGQASGLPQQGSSSQAAQQGTPSRVRHLHHAAAVRVKVAKETMTYTPMRSRPLAPCYNCRNCFWKFPLPVCTVIHLCTYRSRQRLF